MYSIKIIGYADHFKRDFARIGIFGTDCWNVIRQKFAKIFRVLGLIVWIKWFCQIINWINYLENKIRGFIKKYFRWLFKLGF